MTTDDQHSQHFDSGWMVYRRLLSYAFVYWPLLAIATVAMLGMAATEAGFAALMKPLMDESFAEGDSHPLIPWIPLVLIGLFLIRGVAEFGSVYAMRYVGRHVVKRLREELFERLLHMPVQRFQEQSSGELISRVTYNVEQVATAATDGFSTLVRDTLTIIALLAWMFWLTPSLTLTILVIAPVMAILVRVVTKHFRRISHRLQYNMGDVTHVTQEVIEGHRVVRIFGGETYERERFEDINERNRRLHMRMEGIKAAYTPTIQFLVAAVLAFVIWVATSDFGDDTVTAGTFVSFLTAMLLLLSPIRRLSMINATLQRGIAAGQNIFAVLDETPERDTGHVPLDRAEGHLVFYDVAFRYGPEGPDVLKAVSFEVKPGENVALVGRSGSGKTTLVNLLPRFYHPTEGRIVLDGHDLETIRLRDLRRQIAYVGQNVTLFADTVAANIAYGRPEASEAEIREAAQAAHALEFIDRLPDGMQTLVGENGTRLSGGQRQRLAIARALLRDAPILILDEATSALDNESERQVQAALDALVSTRTTLVIAHRLSTVEGADRILVMDNGRVVETGRHDELIALGGVYTLLHRLQFREEVGYAG